MLTARKKEGTLQTSFAACTRRLSSFVFLIVLHLHFGSASRVTTSRLFSMAKDSLAEVTKTGSFQRTESTFRNVVENVEGARYPVEAERYHLIVSKACPWANRCMAMRALKGLENVIGLSTVHPTWGKTKPDLSVEEDAHHGWIFNSGGVPSPNGSGHFKLDDCDDAPTIFKGSVSTVRDIYEQVHSEATKFTVPILYDKKNQEIVSNESSEILRMLNSEFDSLATGDHKELDLYPGALRVEIDEVNHWIYHDINNGVYKSGFAKTQEAYEEAVKTLFASLDRVEAILSSKRFLCGSPSQFTEADLRLFMTLCRFDEVYVVYFKCNIRSIRDYPNIRQYCRDVYQIYGGKIGKTVDMAHIKTHYFTSHPTLNTYAVIPVGPGAELDFSLPPEGRTALN